MFSVKTPACLTQSILYLDENVWLLTLCGARKLQFFYAEILPEFKNRTMPKTVNAICKEMIKVKKIIYDFG